MANVDSNTNPMKGQILFCEKTKNKNKNKTKTKTKQKQKQNKNKKKNTLILRKS
jgi:hypothetical protein